MPGQVLHVLARDVLLQEIGDRRDAEGMGRVEQGHLEILQPSLHHAIDIVAVDGLAGKPALLLSRDGRRALWCRARRARPRAARRRGWRRSPTPS